MFGQIKVLSFPILVTMVLASSSALAGSGLLELIARERSYSDAAVETARDGQRFYNEGERDGSRHRVYEQTPDFASQSQYQHQYREQQDKQAQHRYQYREKSGGQHMNRSGFPGRGFGGNTGGGGRGR